MRQTEACAQSLVFFVRDDVLIHGRFLNDEDRKDEEENLIFLFSYTASSSRELVVFLFFLFAKKPRADDAVLFSTFA